MLARCRYAKHPHYQHYGGRGIVVCERWLQFENFLADMGPRPEGTSLDRIDNDGNYEPGNCRWATGVEQHGNTRTNRYVTYEGRTMAAAAWAKEIGISPARLCGCLQRGLDLPEVQRMAREGMLVPRKTLSVEIAESIRARRKDGESRQSLAIAYGVTIHVVKDIIRNRCYQSRQSA